MSRRPTWDMALAVQAEMFSAVKAVGGLDVQLVFFRGFDECRASRWVSDAAALARLMTSVECRGGYTQIRKVLKHALREASAAKVSALVYVGDAMEEAPDELCNLAGQLALLGVPAFMFQEGNDGEARACFKEIARLTRGATCRFGPGAAAPASRAARSCGRLRGGWTGGTSRLCKRPRRPYFAARTDVQAIVHLAGSSDLGRRHRKARNVPWRSRAGAALRPPGLLRSARNDGARLPAAGASGFLQRAEKAHFTVHPISAGAGRPPLFHGMAANGRCRQGRAMGPQ